MNALVILAIGLGLAATAVLGYAATKPNELRCQRSISVQAPPEKVFALINDLHRWDSWSTDGPTGAGTTRTYEGAPAGRGAVSAWEGSGKVGKGRMEIKESAFPRRIVVEVDFERPFKAHNLNEFTLNAVGSSTELTWAWRGKNIYLGKVLSLVTDMDKMLGKHFETGLANLKALAEER